MKQRVITLCLAIALPAVICACQGEGTSTNREATASTANGNASTTAKPSPTKVNLDEIRAVLAAHDKALNDKNLDAVMGTFSTDPTTTVLGTGAEERWMGTQEIRTAYTEIFKDYDPGTLTTDCSGFKTGGAGDDGTLAWLVATCVCKDSLKGKSREYKLNVSSALAKQGGNWRFVMLHMSNAVTPPPPTK